MIWNNSLLKSSKSKECFGTVPWFEKYIHLSPQTDFALEVTTVQKPSVSGSELAVQVRKNYEPEPVRHSFRRFRFNARFKTGSFQPVSGGSGAGSGFGPPVHYFDFFFQIYSFIVLITNYTL